MKWFAQGHGLEDGAELVIAGYSLGGHSLERRRIGRTQIAAEGVAQQMRDEAAHKPRFLLYEQFFKFVEVGELVLIKEHVADIHLATVLILVAPHTGGSEVFQRKPERIDLVMAPGAIGALAMGRKAFADGELGEIFLVRFIELCRA